jgi:LacI family transcriptional regulator
VGDEVAARVLESAKVLGHRANQSAVALRTRKSHTIGVVLPDITNPVFPPILRGIEEELRKARYVALVADAESDDDQYHVVQQMLARQVDGLILATTTRRDPIIDHCLEHSVPVVSVNRSEDIERTSSVVHDEDAGMRLAVQHLVDLGHRRIGHIPGPQHLSTGHLRRRGFISAMSVAGVKPHEYEVGEESTYSRDGGREALKALLKKRPQLTAIVAARQARLGSGVVRFVGIVTSGRWRNHRPRNRRAREGHQRR